MKRFENVSDVLTALKRAERNYIKRMRKYDWFDASQRPFKTSLRLKKRTGEFVASNVYLDPIALHATSYRWWHMLKNIGGIVVFNSFNYSTSTSQHQWKVRETLKQLGIKIDLEIESPNGLQDLSSAIERYENQIKYLSALIRSPRTRADKNKERAKQIREFQGKVAAIRKLMKGN